MVTSTHRWFWSMTLGAGLVLGLTGEAAAAWLGLRNDLGHAVVIQAATTGSAGARQEPPVVLKPGEVTWDWVAEKTVRQITVHDARPPRPALTRLKVDFTQGDQFYVIQSVGQPGSNEKTVQAVKTNATASRKK
jgi:hypothetical protein